jgi:hypothetical protein
MVGPRRLAACHGLLAQICWPTSARSTSALPSN